MENCKLGYNIGKKLVPKELYRVVTEDSKGKTLLKTHTYETRNKGMPNIPKAANNKYKTSFLNKGIKEFCALPQELKDIENLAKIQIQIEATSLTIIHYPIYFYDHPLRFIQVAINLKSQCMKIDNIVTYFNDHLLIFISLLFN